MKKILNIFLAVSLFFNSGFVFNIAEASITPVPLLNLNNEFPPYSTPLPNDIKLLLKRITLHEALLTSLILEQSLLADGEYTGSDPYNIDVQTERSYLHLFRDKFFNLINNDASFDSESNLIIQDRTAELKGKINAVDLRIADVKSVINHILAMTSENLYISGLDSNNIDSAYHELFRANNCKSFLEESLDFWTKVSGDKGFKISSLSVNTGKPGDTIYITGNNLQDAKVVHFRVNKPYPYGSSYEKYTLTESDFISPNQIKVTVPRLDLSNSNRVAKVSLSKDSEHYLASNLPTNSVSNSLEFTYTNICSSYPSCRDYQDQSCKYINQNVDANGCFNDCGWLYCLQVFAHPSYGLSGEQIEIRGKGINGSKVFFGNVEANIISDSIPGKIIVEIPTVLENGNNTIDVIVKTDGLKTSFPFTYRERSLWNSKISVSSSAGKVGDLITITSDSPWYSGGSLISASVRVYFGNIEASIVSKKANSPTSETIVVEVPAGNTGSVEINLQGNESALRDFIFSYTSICNPPFCPAPTSGCSYINIPYDSNGCQIGCGTLSCPENTCKCPAGQVSFRDRCIAFDVSRVRCSSTSAPVCGCDGVTYTNRCEAMKAGLKSFTSGECGRPALGQ